MQGLVLGNGFVFSCDVIYADQDARISVLQLGWKKGGVGE